MRQGGSAGMPPTGSSLARWSSSATTTLAPLPASRNAIAGGANAVNSGTCTAPRRQMPSSATTSSADLPISVATASPGPTPRPASPAANLADNSLSSPKVRSRYDRSGSTTVKATASAR